MGKGKRRSINQEETAIRGRVERYLIDHGGSLVLDRAHPFFPEGIVQSILLFNNPPK